MHQPNHDQKHKKDVTQKTDSIDALCAARVLLSKLSELPDVNNQDKYWILRALVVNRDQIVKSNTRLKMHLHTLLTQHYPNYREFFSYTFGKTSLAFFKKYPSPKALSCVSEQELSDFLTDESADRQSHFQGQAVSP